MKPQFALSEYLMDIFYIHLTRARNSFNGLSLIMSLTENAPLNFGPLPENGNDILNKTFSVFLGDTRQHFGPPLLSIHTFVKNIRSFLALNNQYPFNENLMKKVAITKNLPNTGSICK
jgi:hypothetical protein